MVVYRMSEIDYLWVMRDEAYLYYLPAFLLSVFIQTHPPFALSKTVDLLPKLSKPQLEALIAFLEYFIASEREHKEQRQSSTQRIIRNWTLENPEDIQLRIMVRLDELKDPRYISFDSM